MRINTLGNRIGMGYGLMAAVLAIAVTATLWQVRGVTRISDRIRELREPTARSSLSMLNAVNESNAALRGWTILGEESFKEERRQLWSNEIDPLLKGMTTLSEKWTVPKNVERLDTIKKRLGRLARSQQQVEDIAHRAENAPATKLFVEDIAPRVQMITEEIALMVAIEQVQETTGDRKRLLGAVADFGASTALAVSELRTYLQSGEESLQGRFDESWRASDARLAKVVSYHRLLTKEQHKALSRLQTARGELEFLAYQALDIRGGQQWNKARFLLATETIPVAQEIKHQLEMMATSQQRLIDDDLAQSRYQIEKLFRTEWALLVVGLGACVVLAVRISRSAILPIKHAVAVANRIASGNLDSDTNIAGTVEAHSLGMALATMTTSLSDAARANQDHSWQTLGRQELSDAMRGNASVASISQSILTQLARHLDCRAGTLYVVGDGRTLQATAGYEREIDRQSNTEIQFGEGRIGQAALTGERSILGSSSLEGSIVNPDVDDAPTGSIVIAPVLYDGEVQAVIELQAVSRFSERQLTFLDLVADGIGIGIESAQNREQIRASEQRIKAIVNTTVDPIITIAATGTIESFNPAAERLFGFSEKEILDKNINKLMPSPYKEEHDGYLRRYVETGKVAIVGLSREVEGQKKDGTTFPISLSVSQVTPDVDNRDDRASLLFTGVIRDLTQQKKMEAELVTREAAIAANLMKSEFLANMSHEIRTPMTAILGFAEIVEGNVRSPENVDAIQTIQRNGKYLLHIINDILDLSKIESGKLEVEHTEFSLRQVVADVSSLMRVRANAKGLPLEVEFDGLIPEYIQSDPTRLRQILINLIGNAIKFTEVGKIRVVIRLLESDQDDSVVQIEVADTGIGMNGQQIDKLFRPFVQADTSMTRKFGGTGLGLTISKRLTEMLGGTIQVQSELGAGSTFSVTMKTGSLQDAEMVDAMTDAKTPAMPASKLNTDETQIDCRILLAEDGPDNQRLIAFILKKAGAKVVIAENGQIACDLALAARDEGNPFDMILMDMQMPVLDGYGATKKLREAGYTGSIVALTAHAMNGDRTKCIDAGCDDYATKPINRKQLISLLVQYATDQVSA